MALEWLLLAPVDACDLSELLGAEAGARLDGVTAVDVLADPGQPGKPEADCEPAC